MANNLTLLQAVALLERSNGWDIDPAVLEELSKMDLATPDGALTKYGKHVVQTIPSPRPPKRDPNVWISHDGRATPITNLDTTHLRNILNFIIKNNYAHEIDEDRRAQCTKLLAEVCRRQMTFPSEFLAFCLPDERNMNGQ